ncbi:hypothetical protein BDY17DRAFT_108152 [Neohortaea acidophila]|uniref:Uncharacterized protein n=1 Tax=Neohortaea acidophila TaxID=245834 RepID=A0A6A6PZM7_9PEZI|nr:uncharacterized protein BDY17DRAFT_108152 [Neohortaea acidophila]KAF2485600.1 hypothetical protein BDY17DRAFT_108152 [Neohortaea acidophila]
MQIAQNPLIVPQQINSLRWSMLRVGHTKNISRMSQLASISTSLRPPLPGMRNSLTRSRLRVFLAPKLPLASLRHLALAVIANPRPPVAVPGPRFAFSRLYPASDNGERLRHCPLKTPKTTSYALPCAMGLHNRLRDVQRLQSHMVDGQLAGGRSRNAARWRCGWLADLVETSPSSAREHLKSCETG